MTPVDDRSEMRRQEAAMAALLSAGDAVWYAPRWGGKEYACTAGETPRRLSKGTFVLLINLPAEYRSEVERERRVIYAAACSHVRPRATTTESTCQWREKP